MKFAGVKITQESILAARQWYMTNARACIDLARSRDVPKLNEGEFYVNDLPEYVARERERIEEHRQGQHDHTFAFMQTAHYIQTGECIALLP